MHHHRRIVRFGDVYPRLRTHECRYIYVDTDHYKQSNFPTDSDWVACNYGKNSDYPFVYFPDLLDINTVTVASYREFVLADVPTPETLSSSVEPTLKFPLAQLTVSTLLRSISLDLEVSVHLLIVLLKKNSWKQLISRKNGIFWISMTVFVSAY